jgi:hypothetical protein
VTEELRYRIDDDVAVVGSCGHRLKVEHINFAGSTDTDGFLPQIEATAFYYLRCQDPSCSKKYQWKVEYIEPRPADD